MKKFFSTVLSAAIVSLSFAFVGAVPANAGTDKIDICHATGNGKYVPLSVSKDGAAEGHAGTGHPNPNQIHVAGDIIPAYDWIDENRVRQYFDGQNLDKAYLLKQGCKENATPVTANPNVPTYEPATCLDPTAPHGKVTIPDSLGDGVKRTTPPVLSGDQKTWTVTYTLADNTDDATYSWKGNENGIYTFAVVPITEDPLWVTDSRTGEGRCELSNTGATGFSNTALMLGGGGVGLAAILLFISGIMKRRENA